MMPAARAFLRDATEFRECTRQHVTEAEFASFTPNSEVVRYLELTRQRLGLQKSEMKVLDWGSGRDYVAWLRQAGYDAYGAEIRKEAVDRGKDLFHGPRYDVVA